MYIQPLTNQLFKSVKRLRNKQHRSTDGLFIVEGLKPLELIPREYPILYYVASSDFTDYHLLHNGIQAYSIETRKFRQLCDTKSPPDILGVLPYKKNVLTEECIVENGFYIFLENINDPGNFGTIIRTADAFSISGVITSKHSVSAYNPKTIRATMGSIFNVPIYEEVSLNKCMSLFKNMHYNIICGTLNGDKMPFTYDFTRPTILLMGNEANGLTKEAEAHATDKIKIPITGGAESLNISIASSIFMYECMKGRLNEQSDCNDNISE